MGKRRGGGNNNKIVSVKKLSGKECYDLVKVMGLSDYQCKIFQERIQDWWGDDGVSLFHGMTSVSKI